MSESGMLDWRDRAVLVTGGAGFIGSHLVDALVAEGARVRVLDDLSTGSRSNLEQVLPGIRFLEANLTDRDACREICAGVEAVFHQAALGSVPRSMRDPAATVEANVFGTATLWAAARDAGVRRVVYASSSSVYGDSETMPRREGSEGRALSPYALSKQMNEELADVYGRCFGMELVGLRYFNVYGPRQSPEGPYAAVIPLFFDACRRRQSPRIYGDGEQSRDFTFVDDAVRANLLAARAPAASCGRAYNVGTSRGTTVNELARAIRAYVGGVPEPTHVEERTGDVRHSAADLTAVREALDYEPRVSLAEGLRRTWTAFPSPTEGSDGPDVRQVTTTSPRGTPPRC